MVEQQGEGEDKEWQRWLQDLFNCGEMFISWCLSMITVVSVIYHTQPRGCIPYQNDKQQALANVINVNSLIPPRTLECDM